MGTYRAAVMDGYEATRHIRSQAPLSKPCSDKRARHALHFGYLGQQRKDGDNSRRS